MIFLYVGNFIFLILFPLVTFFMGFLGFFLILISKYIKSFDISNFPRLWGKTILFLSKHLLNLKVDIQGEIPENAIFAPQHQSVLEIIAISSVVKNPTFVFKKSLLNIPFFGYCLLKLNMIPVDRSKFNPNWLSQAQSNLKNNLSVIIFPEGKTLKYNEYSEYKKGVFKLAKSEGKKIIPVAVDTGKFWPKHAFLKKEGTSKIVFGNPIEPCPKLLRETFSKLIKQ